MKTYAVYMLSNKPRGTIYIGVTGDIRRRIIEHRRGLVEGFTRKYAVKNLVWFEQYTCVYKAIWREKQLKHWLR
jgi:putative endonuclease